MINKIVIYDFDGTICASPLPTDENKKLWEKANGRPWPHKGDGWWAKEESLCLKTFNPKLNEMVKQSALQNINDLETYTVLLTGRVPKFQKTVKEILRRGGLPYFDAYYFNDMGKTEIFKIKIMESLKAEFPKVEFLEMWEDRAEHIPIFAKWGHENYGSNFKLNIV